MTEGLHESSHSSSMQRIRNSSSLQRQQVVAEGLPIAQGGPLPFPLGDPQPCICLFGCLVTAAVDQVEVAHGNPGLRMAPKQSFECGISAFDFERTFDSIDDLVWTFQFIEHLKSKLFARNR